MNVKLPRVLTGTGVGPMTSMSAVPPARPVGVRPRSVVLEGVVGSVAYGLNTPDSDVDTLGIYARPTRDLFAVHPDTAETIISHDPDMVWHEAGKYARLALNVNPNIIDLLWLTEHTITTDLGRDLVNIRESFLSGPRVKDAYLEYATAQFGKLVKRADGSFSSDTKNRTAKHARHMARLLRHGRELYTTGTLTVNIGDDAPWYHEFGAADPDTWTAWFEREQREFANATTRLPDLPDTTAVQRWLTTVRYTHLDPF